MQNEQNENENYKSLIFSIKASALIECIEDNTELGKAMRKLMQSQPVQIALPTQTVNQVSEEDEDENEVHEVTDPFNKAEPKVRDYVLKEESDELESGMDIFGIDKITYVDGLAINNFVDPKYVKGQVVGISNPMYKAPFKFGKIDFGYWAEEKDQYVYRLVPLREWDSFPNEIPESNIVKLNRTQIQYIKSDDFLQEYAPKPKVNQDNPPQLASIELPKKISKKKPEKPQPTLPPMFKIGQRVIYTPDEKWYEEGGNLNPNIKIGNIVSLIWDSHYNEYKYYFANETETFSYLKDTFLLAVNEEQEQKIRIKLDRANASAETEIPSPKFSRGNIVQFINSTFDKQYEVRSIHYQSSSKSFYYAVQSADGKFIYPEGYQISEDKLELVPKETTQVHTPKAEPIVERKPEAQEKPVKAKKIYTYNKVEKKTPTVIQNNAFRELNEQIDFICEPYSIKQLRNIYNLIDLPQTGYKKSKNQATSNAFLDMVIEQINASRLLIRGSKGYYKLNKFIQFNKISPNSILYLKDEHSYTVTEHYRINPNNKSKKAYYRAEGNPKKISELGFYKKLYLYEYIDIERWRNLKYGKDRIDPKEVFQNESNKLTFKKSTAQVYELKDSTLRALVSALLFKKIQKLKSDNKKSENAMGVVKRKVGRPKKVVKTINVAVKRKRGRPSKKLNNQ